MLKKYSLLAVMLLCLAACTTTSATTPLQQVNGSWELSFDETLAASQELRDLVKDDSDMEEYMRESMQGLLLTIDVERSLIILTVEGDVDDESEFTVVSESAEEGKLVLDMSGDEFTLVVNGDRMEWLEAGDTLVFKRVK